jgi:hypothetical protein
MLPIKTNMKHILEYTTACHQLSVEGPDFVRNDLMKASNHEVSCSKECFHYLGVNLSWC